MTLNKLYDDNDFLFLKIENSHKYTDRELQEIRESNLLDLIYTLEKLEITYFLEGKTLLSTILFKSLKLHDHDDDIGIFENQYQQFRNVGLSQLSAMGFSVIRYNSDMISIFRNNRYIDVINFKKKGEYIGYGNKYFPKIYYSKLQSHPFKDIKLVVPRFKILLITRRYSSFLALKFLRDTYHKLILIDERIVYRNKTRVISKNEFLKFEFESYNSLNWVVRKPHLELILDREKRKIQDILNSFKYNTKYSVVETDTTNIFKGPINISKRFWNSGNNFFIYPLIYGFRHNVVPYSDCNVYIQSKKQPMLYSKQYYQSLIPMSNNEISQLFRENPIEITDGVVTSGRHRVAAMIGRLSREEPYIPILAVVKSRRLIFRVLIQIRKIFQ